MPDSATTGSLKGSGTPLTPNKPPSAMTSGNVIGSTQIAGLRSCAPHRPTATIATRWSNPVIGCRKPLCNPLATPAPVCASADETGTSASNAAIGRARLQRSVLHAVLL